MSSKESKPDLPEFSSLISLAKEFRKSPFADSKIMKLQKRRKREEFLSLADQAAAHLEKILKKRKKEYDQCIPKAIKLVNGKPPSKTTSLVDFVGSEEAPFLNELNVFLMEGPKHVSVCTAADDFSKLTIGNKNQDKVDDQATKEELDSESGKANYIIDLTASIEKVMINEPVMPTVKDSVLISASVQSAWQDHSVDSSDLVKTGSNSNFGKIICRRWKKLRKPQLCNVTPSKLERFLFDCPSPDDEILTHLRK